MNRRTFLKLGAACCSSLLLHACQPHLETPVSHTRTPSPSPTGTPLPPPSSTPPPSATSPAAATLTLEPTSTAVPRQAAQIVLVKTDDRAAGVQRALEMLGAGDFKGKRVLVKPNYNSSHPAPGSTDNEVLIPALQWLKRRGADRLSVADRSGMGDTRAVMEAKGLPGLAGDYNFDYFVFDGLPAEDWVKVNFEGCYWPGGFPIARPVLEADGVISLCCLKTHRFGGHFTLSLKNSVGMVAKTIPGEATNYMADILHTSPHQRELIADINRAYSPDLIVMDGLEAFVDGGPEAGEPAHPRVILAGTDRVAIDAVGVAILRLFHPNQQIQKGPIFSLAQIARAASLGIGIDGPEKIELVSADAESEAVANEIRRVLIE